MDYYLILFLICCVNWKLSICYSEFRDRIPNGRKIPNPCNRSATWPGVGHKLLQGPGPLNPFGRDFAANGLKYDVDFCKKDSDGDSKTNGEELGDPDCTWQIGTAPAVDAVSELSHPGICEPIDSPQCASRNEFLASVDSCSQTFTTTHWCPAILAPDVKSLTLRFDETVLPFESDTLYYCQQFTVPHDEEYHIIGWEPIVSNNEIMHHLILFICDTFEQERALLQSGAYQSPTECPMIMKECSSSTIGWAFGVPRVCYSNNTGVLMGKGEYKKAILQIHYNNPAMKPNLTDSSGIKLYYTAKKRQHNIATVEVGQIDIAVPPRSNQMTRVLSKTFQTQACSLQQLAPHPAYNITSVFIHMHKLGVHAKLDIVKPNGRIITLIDDDINYDEPKTISFIDVTMPILEPGDNIDMECVFKSNDQDHWVYFGERTSDEMCIGYLEVFPRPQNTNSLALENFGKIDICAMEQVELGGFLENCNMSSFSENIVGWELTAPGGLMTFCNDPHLGYPAHSCTYSCYMFLKDRNLLGQHPCMEGDIFNMAAYYAISEVMDDIYRIRSQTEKCRALEKPPLKSNKDKLLDQAIAVLLANDGNTNDNNSGSSDNRRNNCHKNGSGKEAGNDLKMVTLHIVFLLYVY